MFLLSIKVMFLEDPYFIGMQVKQGFLGIGSVKKAILVHMEKTCDCANTAHKRCVFAVFPFCKSSFVDPQASCEFYLLDASNPQCFQDAVQHQVAFPLFSFIFSSEQSENVRFMITY